LVVIYYLFHIVPRHFQGNTPEIVSQARIISYTWLMLQLDQFSNHPFSPLPKIERIDMYIQPGRVSWRRKNSGSKIELFLTPRMGITLLKFKLFVGEILIDDLTWCIFIYESFDELLSICLLLGNLQSCIEKWWIFMRIHLSWGWILEWFLFLLLYSHNSVEEEPNDHANLPGFQLIYSVLKK
jgi:hypothetical protein